MDCGDGGGNFVRGATLAEPGAGAVDAGWRDRDGLVICERAEYFAADSGTSGFGSAGVVGVSVGVASLDESGAGVLELLVKEVFVIRKVERKSDPSLRSG